MFSELQRFDGLIARNIILLFRDGSRGLCLNLLSLTSFTRDDKQGVFVAAFGRFRHFPKPKIPARLTGIVRLIIPICDTVSPKPDYKYLVKIASDFRQKAVFPNAITPGFRIPAQNSLAHQNRMRLLVGERMAKRFGAFAAIEVFVYPAQHLPAAGKPQPLNVLIGAVCIIHAVTTIHRAHTSSSSRHG